MSIKKWSLEKIKFLMSHIEDFIDEDGSHQVSRTAKEFEPQSDISSLSSLSMSEQDTLQTPNRVLERLVPFYEFGFLAQKSTSSESSNWWITDFFWRGNMFRLRLEDQIEVQKFIPPISPLEVKRGQTSLFLKGLKLDFMECQDDSEIFALRPTSHATYFLSSDLPKPWSISHLEETRKLVTKAFNY